MMGREFIGGDQLEACPGANPSQDGEVVTFHDFSVIGMLPPFSDFFMAVLEAFGLHMLHLHPNSVLILVTFAYACEAFIGLMPSVALFWHFFMPRRGRSRWIAGGVSFCLKQENARQYPDTKIHPNWQDWRWNWYLVQAGSTSPHLLVPTAPAESLANSKDVSAQDEALLPIVRKFWELPQSF